MRFARLLAVAALFAATLAEAQATAWRSTVAPPRAGLPAVSVELGYPGGYVPVASAPITLRASAGNASFDGYIGFHFRAGDRQTYDTPVIARASLRPGGSWTFSTYANPRRSARSNHDSDQWTQPRAIAIEWRDASMNVLARMSAGIPPWSLERIPLVITNATRNGTGPQRALDSAAYARRPDALPALAQWYAGFSHVVAPLEVWLEVAPEVRDVIFASSREVVLHGLPRADQTLDTLTATLLPVTFSAAPGAYRVPWPYATADAAETEVTTPRSWAAKRSAYAVGSGPLPYMVRSPVATWVADAAGIARRLPVAEAAPIALEIAKQSMLAPSRHQGIDVASPTPSALLRHAPVRIAVALALLLSIAGWLLLRKTPRAAVAALLVLAAVGLLAARGAIRPPAAAHRSVSIAEVAPGVLEHVESIRSYGDSLIEAPRLDDVVARMNVFAPSEAHKDAEIRSAGMPAGAIRSGADWHASWRSWSRRELGSVPKVTIRERDATKLVLEYDSPDEIDRIHARWQCGSRLCWGETRVDGRSGTATIEHGQLLWPAADGAGWWSSIAGMRVQFLRSRGNETLDATWLEPAGASTQQSTPQSIVLTEREPRHDGSGTFAFALPRALPPAPTALVSVKLNTPSTRVTLALPDGTTTPLDATGRSGLDAGTRAYAIPPPALAQIVAHGGIVEVTVASDEPRNLINPFNSVSLEIWEKKP